MPEQQTEQTEQTSELEIAKILLNHDQHRLVLALPNIMVDFLKTTDAIKFESFFEDLRVLIESTKSSLIQQREQISESAKTLDLIS